MLETWILAMMLVLEPNAPWKGTYEASAHTIAEVSERESLFAGKDGPRKTASLFVSLGWFEARFKPDAEGDHAKLAGGQKGEPASFCMMQIGRSNLRWLGTTPEAIQKDFGVCVRTARKMLSTSMHLCSTRPLEERLAWYAAGGDGCPSTAGVRESGHRIRKAQWIFAKGANAGAW